MKCSEGGETTAQICFLLNKLRKQPRHSRPPTKWGGLWILLPPFHSLLVNTGQQNRAGVRDERETSLKELGRRKKKSWKGRKRERKEGEKRWLESAGYMTRRFSGVFAHGRVPLQLENHFGSHMTKPLQVSSKRKQQAGSSCRMSTPFLYYHGVGKEWTSPSSSSSSFVVKPAPATATAIELG